MREYREVYLDNAATTRLAPEVLEAMLPYMKDWYGNPSSTYTLGNASKTAIEEVRRSVIACLGATRESNVFFTSSGTEANNWAITGAVEGHDIRHVITSPLEHESVLQCIKKLVSLKKITASYVEVNQQGQLQYHSLIALLEKHPKSLVSLMHGNNEIGNLTDLNTIGNICKKYQAIFHTDMVQTLTYCEINLAKCPVDLCTGSAHKLHGPKGIGFIYMQPNIRLKPLLYGGMQERGLRAGTENVAGIVGLGKALEIATYNKDKHRAHLQKLKAHMIQNLKKAIPNIQFHGLSQDPNHSLCNLLNIGLSLQNIDSEMLVFKLSIQGISASRGSACMSGTSLRSHVLEAIKLPKNRTAIRFSLSKYSTYEDIDYTVKRLSAIMKK
ncbi:MAG: cysteine desulfurase family protein [Bacteroidota bacterium]